MAFSILLITLLTVVPLVINYLKEDNQKGGDGVKIAEYSEMVLPPKSTGTEAPPQKYEKKKENTPQSIKEVKPLPEEKLDTAVNNIVRDEQLMSKSDARGEISPYHNFSSFAADTGGLSQYYSEKTLNVSIKYPPGWTYIDQNVKNKLDGVTFWASTGFTPPPYIFLEVKEKYLFNPSRYKYNMELNNDAVAYYNDPEEMEGQVSQLFYIRTDDDEDYSLKLIVKGKDNFISFQPGFFAMIKTFRFGRSLF